MLCFTLAGILGDTEHHTFFLACLMNGMIPGTTLKPGIMLPPISPAYTSLTLEPRLGP